VNNIDDGYKIVPTLYCLEIAGIQTKEALNAFNASFVFKEIILL